MKVFAITLATVLLISSVPVFMVFGLSSAIVAIWELNLPWSSLIQVAFGSVTKHVLVAVPLFIFAGMAMLR
jgi:TRAP-type mannitol/chloroaromatic compound transport system permease large subunit